MVLTHPMLAEPIIVEVEKVGGGQVTLGFTAEEKVQILRQELLDKERGTDD